MSHVVGRLGPDDLHTLYGQGTPASIDVIILHCENKAGRKIACHARINEKITRRGKQF